MPDPTSELYSIVIANLRSLDKQAFVPIPAGQMPPAPADPMAGMQAPPGMPPGMPPGAAPGMPPGAIGMPPGMPVDPAAVGAPPTDPAMMGAMGPAGPGMPEGMDPAAAGAAPVSPDGETPAAAGPTQEAYDQMSARLDAVDSRLALLDKIIQKMADKAGLIIMDQPAEKPAAKPAAKSTSKEASAPEPMGEVGKDKLGAIKTSVDIGPVITGSPSGPQDDARKRNIKSILARMTQ